VIRWKALAAGGYDGAVALARRSKLDADKLVALKIQNPARRLEIRLLDARGVEHVVSLPIPVAQELATLISDACSFIRKN